MTTHLEVRKESSVEILLFNVHRSNPVGILTLQEKNKPDTSELTLAQPYDLEQPSYPVEFPERHLPLALLLAQHVRRWPVVVEENLFSRNIPSMRAMGASDPMLVVVGRLDYGSRYPTTRSEPMKCRDRP